MATALLMIIYLAFISLGLPDSLLGSAWTVMHQDMGIPVSGAGIISTAIISGTILSSFLSERLTRKFGTGLVTSVSVAATAFALFGFSISPSIWWMLLFAIPLGIGGGSIDAALNNHVALHYKPHHMSWLHSFWGVGATLGPVVMAWRLSNNGDWRSGYLLIAIFQTVLVLLMFSTLPLWRKVHVRSDLDIVTETDEEKGSSNPIFRIPGVSYALLSFLLYVGLEMSTGLWGASYLVASYRLAPEKAAAWVSIYYAGITVGRLVTGFLTMRFSCRKLILSGQVIVLVGILLLMISGIPQLALIGLLLIGLGCAPIFPCMIHETPKRFGAKNSPKIIGIQMGFSYIGSAILPPVFGGFIPVFGLQSLPYFLLLYAIFMLLASERIAKMMHKHTA